MNYYTCTYITALQSRGVDLNRPIAASCYSGIMACIYSVAAAHAKLPDIAVYPVSSSSLPSRWKIMYYQYI